MYCTTVTIGNKRYSFVRSDDGILLGHEVCNQPTRLSAQNGYGVEYIDGQHKVRSMPNIGKYGSFLRFSGNTNGTVHAEIKYDGYKNMPDGKAASFTRRMSWMLREIPAFRACARDERVSTFTITPRADNEVDQISRSFAMGWNKNGTIKVTNDPFGHNEMSNARNVTYDSSTTDPENMVWISIFALVQNPHTPQSLIDSLMLEHPFLQEWYVHNPRVTTAQVISMFRSGSLRTTAAAAYCTRANLAQSDLRELAKENRLREFVALNKSTERRMRERIMREHLEHARDYTDSNIQVSRSTSQMYMNAIRVMTYDCPENAVAYAVSSCMGKNIDKLGELVAVLKRPDISAYTEAVATSLAWEYVERKLAIPDGLGKFFGEMFYPERIGASKMLAYLTMENKENWLPVVRKITERIRAIETGNGREGEIKRWKNLLRIMGKKGEIPPMYVVSAML